MLCKKCSWLRNCQHRSQTRVEGGTELSCALLLARRTEPGENSGAWVPFEVGTTSSEWSGSVNVTTTLSCWDAGSCYA